MFDINITDCTINHFQVNDYELYGTELGMMSFLEFFVKTYKEKLLDGTSMKQEKSFSQQQTTDMVLSGASHDGPHIAEGEQRTHQVTRRWPLNQWAKYLPSYVKYLIYG